MLIRLTGITDSNTRRTSMVNLNNIRLINFAEGCMFFDTRDLNGVYYQVEDYDHYLYVLNAIYQNAWNKNPSLDIDFDTCKPKKQEQVTYKPELITKGFVADKQEKYTEIDF